MNNDFLIVNAAAALLIFFILWWFFAATPKTVFAASDAPILVLIKDGVYQPSFIQIAAGQSVKLHFLRKDNAPCSASVSFPELNASYPLPMNQIVEVTLPPLVPGELNFTCQMGMYRGKIIVS